MLRVVLRTRSFFGPHWSLPRSAYMSNLSGKRLEQAALAKAESFLNGTNSVYVEEMYDSWMKDPRSVHRVSQGLILVCV